MKAATLKKKTGKGASVSGYRFVQKVGDIHEYTLEKNGLRVLVKEDFATPLVGLMVTYHVGSRNEVPGFTGATHFLEHLLFKGSDNYNEKNGKKLEFLLGAKGALLNASTWFDRTNYYEVLPAEHFELAVGAEADRMRNAWLTEEYRKTEIAIVRNEFERGENKPIEPVFKQLWALAFQAHPYHHDTIGWRSDIEKVPIERLQWFYDQFYWPNNATVSVVGAVKKEDALRIVQKYFGVHSKAPHAFPEVYTEEPVQEGERRAIVERASTSNMVGIGYKIPSALHEDTPYIDLMNAVLSDGKTSRLYKAFVDTKLATDASAFNFILRDPSITMAFITLAPRVSHDAVEKKLKKEYERLATSGPTKAELNRIKKRFKAAHLARRDGPFAFLTVLNEYIGLGDWSLFETYIDRINAATPKDIQRVARAYAVDSQSTVCWFKGKTS